jgi:tripartite-type tricarboxylate transporter receptor subunit TctC
MGRKDFPAMDLSGFISYVKTNGSRLNAGHAGVGSMTHGACSLLDSLLGVSPSSYLSTVLAPL